MNEEKKDKNDIIIVYRGFDRKIGGEADFKNHHLSMMALNLNVSNPGESVRAVLESMEKQVESNVVGVKKFNNYYSDGKKTFENKLLLLLNIYINTYSGTGKIHKEFRYGKPNTKIKKTAKKQLQSAELFEPFQKLIEDKEENWNTFQSPFVSTSLSLEHAYAYAEGRSGKVKSQKDALFIPKFDDNGKLDENGGIFGSVFVYEIKKNDGFYVDISKMHSNEELLINCRIKNENEITFLGFIDINNKFKEFKLEIPSFDQIFSKEIENSFGLNEKNYNEFQNLFNSNSDEKEFQKYLSVYKPFKLKQIGEYKFS
jgi:hypothetical protein